MKINEIINEINENIRIHLFHIYDYVHDEELIYKHIIYDYIIY